jgi:hypothetical protein
VVDRVKKWESEAENGWWRLNGWWWGAEMNDGANRQWSFIIVYKINEKKIMQLPWASNWAS